MLYAHYMSSKRLLSGLTIAITCMLTLTGCAASVANRARARASFDLECDQKKLNVVEIDGNAFTGNYSYGISGCGKKASYVCREMGFRGIECLKNSETTSTSTASTEKGDSRK